MIFFFCNQVYEKHFPPHFKQVYLELLPKQGINTRVFAFTNDNKARKTFANFCGYHSSLHLNPKGSNLLKKLWYSLNASIILSLAIVINRKTLKCLVFHNDPLAAIVPITVCKFFKIKFVFRVTHLIPEDYAKRQGIFNLVIAKSAIFLRSVIQRVSDKNIFMSDQMSSYLNGNNEDLVIPSVVPILNTENVPKAGYSKEIQNWLKSNLNKLNLIYIGTMDMVRQNDILLQVINELNKLNVEASLTILGVQNLKNDLQHFTDLINLHGLNEQIKIFPPLPYDHLNQVFKQMDFGLCLFPNDVILNCNSPIKTLDYIANGLPAIVSSNKDSIYIVNETKFGLVVEHDAKQIAETLQKTDVLSLNKYRMEARNWIANNRSCETAAKCLGSMF